MKQFIIPIVAVIMGIIMPIVGMTMTPTRDLILGLASEEAILKLADTIDTNRVDSDSKIQELQALVDAQKLEIENQKIKLVEAESTLENLPSTDAVKTIASDLIYCQSGANAYTKEAYKSYKDGPEREREYCEKNNDSVYAKKQDQDCDEIFKKWTKRWDEFKIAYDAYHKKCD